MGQTQFGRKYIESSICWVRMNKEMKKKIPIDSKK